MRVINTETPEAEATALYDFEATDPSHLALKTGDRLRIYIREETGWWSGLNDHGQSGWFPASYVELISDLNTVSKESLSPAPELPGPAPIAYTTSQDCSDKQEESEWQTYYTEDNTPYYVHRVTGESVWTLPESSQNGVRSKSGLLHANTGYIDLQADPDLQSPPLPSSPNRRGHKTSNGPPSPALSPGPTDGPRGSAIGMDPFHRRPSRITSRLSNRRSTTTIEKKAEGGSALATEEGRFAYANNFWSDKGDQSGFDVLVIKHRTGKEVCKDVAQFMAERARLEENYAKALLSLAKSTLGEHESGTSKTAWNQLKFDVESQARSRLSFAEKLNKEVQEPLMKFKDEQKKTRKNYEQTISVDRRQLTVKYLEATKLHRVYMSKCKEAESVELIVQRGQADHMTKRDFMKIEDQARKERKKASMAGMEYKVAVEEYERVRVQWEEDMNSACVEFQQAEESRIEFLKRIMQSYLKVQKEVNQSCKESSEMVESSIDAVSKEIDIEMFVKSHHTGNLKPLPLAFETYDGQDQ